MAPNSVIPCVILSEQLKRFTTALGVVAAQGEGPQGAPQADGTVPDLSFGVGYTQVGICHLSKHMDLYT